MNSPNYEKLQKPERDWKTMILIAHDFFHNWRQAVNERYGESVTEELALRFWELVGKTTADMYKKGKIDPQDLEQIALGAARSSEIMGETVRVERDGEAWLLIHDACPWINSFKKAGFEGKCQPGCDRWFETTVKELSPNLAIDTLSCLANGEKHCIRKYYRV